MKLCLYAWIFSLALLSQSAFAGQWNILNSGNFELSHLSNHTKQVGGGIQYEFDRINTGWVNFLTASQIMDARQDGAYMGGAGMVKRFRVPHKHDVYMDLGVIASVMSRQDYQHGAPFFDALPTASVGFSDFALNISYLPTSRNDLQKVWLLQLKLSQFSLW